MARKKKEKQQGDAGNGKAAAPANGHNGDRDSDDAIRANFLQHRTAWNNWKEKREEVDQIERDTKAALKADGFKVVQFQIADKLTESPKSEAKVIGEVKDRLIVARWIGHPIGKKHDQFDFLEILDGHAPVPAPSDDDHFDAGKQAAMSGAVASPPEHLSSASAQVWLSGYHEAQASLVRSGIQPFEQGQEQTEEI